MYRKESESLKSYKTILFSITRPDLIDTNLGMGENDNSTDA
jgi:hypothetical protein